MGVGGAVVALLRLKGGYSLLFDDRMAQAIAAQTPAAGLPRNMPTAAPQLIDKDNDIIDSFPQHC